MTMLYPDGCCNALDELKARHVQQSWVKHGHRFDLADGPPRHGVEQSIHQIYTSMHGQPKRELGIHHNVSGGVEVGCGSRGEGHLGTHRRRE